MCVILEAANVDYDAGVESGGNGEYRIVRDIIIGVAETMENASTKFSVSMDCGMSDEMIESLANYKNASGTVNHRVY